VKILNNLVWELLNEESVRVRGQKTFTFTNPIPRWVHVAMTAGGPLRVSLDKTAETRDVIVFEDAQKTSKETMRFLSAGEHTLTLSCDEGTAEVDSVRVRAIAELIFQYGHNSHVKPFEKYIPDFTARNILPHVNTLVVRDYWLKQPFAREWTKNGGHFLYAALAPGLRKREPIPVEEAADYLAKTGGYTHPLAHGVIADEYGDSSARCGVDAKAVRKLHAMPQFRSRRYYPYGHYFYDGPEGRELMAAVAETGGANAWKTYLAEPDTEQLARLFIATSLTGPAMEYRRLCPGSLPHLVPCIGYFSAPPEFCDVNPGVNYKTFLDMVFHAIATEPAFFGVRGYMTYGISYTDEEIARWGAKLFRRYGIEGATERATDDPYILSHIRNGDFVDGLEGWSASPAAEGAIRPVTRVGFGWNQGRFPRTDRGDTALLMVRSARRPNVVSQTIRSLEPGRFYSLRMYTGDYEDMSKKMKHAVTIRIDNVDLVPKQCFTHVFRNYPGHRIPGQEREDAQWMNYHWRIFRAKGKSATLTISDWASARRAGGPMGRQTIFNFVQVQPYDPEPARDK
jgi:hypothetical protein